jgi:putative PIN family toxin of toxin-antitoxin system
MNVPQIVIDTSVLISALLSQRGAAYRLLMLSDSGRFEINLSVPLMAEYEEVAKRMLHRTDLSMTDLEDILDYLCRVGNQRKIFFLWRPFLPDPDDDMVLELGVAAQCQYIVTYNRQHFAGSEQFGTELVTPQKVLIKIGELS